MNNTPIPFFICHYRPEKVRRNYIEHEWSKQPERIQFVLQFITEHDKEEPHVQSSYAYDENLYREMIEPIKDLQVGYWLGLRIYQTTPFKSCVDWYKFQNTNLDQDFARYPWLKEGPLSAGDVSLIWKHREAWTRIANGKPDFAILAEDEFIFAPQSLKFLVHLMQILPKDAEYVDVAGGAGFRPRIGNKCIHNYFYEIVPPKTRTTCTAILSKTLAQRLIDLNPRACLGIDWMLNWAFMHLNTKVYWVEPTVFGHGSQMNVYASIRESEHRARQSGS
jgi:hypothetical protein